MLIDKNRGWFSFGALSVRGVHAARYPEHTPMFSVSRLHWEVDIGWFC